MTTRCRKIRTLFPRVSVFRWAKAKGGVRTQERSPRGVGPTLWTFTSSRCCYWSLQHWLWSPVRIKVTHTFPQSKLHAQSNTSHLSHRWHVAGKSECSAKCGSGYRSVDVQCMKYSLMTRQSERMETSACADIAKPPTRESCHGDCLLKSWQYSAWSQVQTAGN